MTEAVLLLGVVPAGRLPAEGARGHRRLPAGSRDALAVDVAAAMLASEDPDDILELAILQNDILSAYAAEGDVLPIVLGAAFSSDKALLRHLAAQKGRLDHLAERLAGRAEFLVTVELEPETAIEPPRAAKDGAGFLRARKRQRDDRTTLTHRRMTFAADVARKATHYSEREVSRRPSPGRLASLSLLVPRREARSLAREMSVLAPRGAELGVSLSMIGPCAPISFVGDEEDADAGARV